jgi:hypothetical protein
MDAPALRQVLRTSGPFASVYLPTATSWRPLRHELTTHRIDGRTLAVLDEAVNRRTDIANRALVTSGGRLLVDEPSVWPPETPVARVSGLPYLLPLTHRYGAHVHPDARYPDRSVYDQFVFEAGRPDGHAVDGLPACTTALRQHNADALIIAVDRLAEHRVWVGNQLDLVSTETSLRGTGVPITNVPADEALPSAALAIGAEVVVTADQLPLTDGVGVLLRHR